MSDSLPIMMNAKSIKSFFFLFCALIGFLEANAAGFKVDDIWYFPNGSTVSVDHVYSTDVYYGNIVIPNTVTYKGVIYTVTSIGCGAFSHCKYVKSITLPNTLRLIDQEAIEYCKITSIAIPSSVKTIAYRAFKGCNNLKRVDISDLNAWIEIDFSGMLANPLYNDSASLFLNGQEIKDLVITNNVSIIKPYVFCGGLGIKNVTIPNSVTSIGNAAFKNCTGLATLNIGESVSSIGIMAFDGCKDLATINIFAKNPPELGSDCFTENCYENAIVHVPAASLNTYKTNKYWRKFHHIVGDVAQSKVSVSGDLNRDNKVVKNNKAAENNKATKNNKSAQNNRSATNAPISITQKQGKNSENVKPKSGKLNDHEYVDLGLSVKWATKNVGAVSYVDVGDFFAWAETGPKNQYDWPTYKFCVNGATYMAKYNNSSLGGNKDGKHVLEEMDDAATKYMGKGWRMPTSEEINELIKNCTWTWYDNYNGSDACGYLVKSNVPGYTNNSIFLPAGGYRGGTSYADFNQTGSYWALSLDCDSFGNLKACHLFFGGGEPSLRTYNRFLGMNVRGVVGERPKNVPFFMGKIEVQVTNPLYIFTIKVFGGGLSDYGWEFSLDEDFSETINARDLSPKAIDINGSILRLVISRDSLLKNDLMDAYIRAYAKNSYGTGYSN